MEVPSFHPVASRDFLAKACAFGGRVHPPPPFNVFDWMQSYAETWLAGFDPVGIGQKMRARRLSALINLALCESPFYRRRSRHARCLADFEPVTKIELMREFDSWATDRGVTRHGVEAFLCDPKGVADAWLGRYLLWTSSGTSGQPTVFVQDSASMAAYDAIDALRLRGTGPALGQWGVGRTFAFIGATGGHFAGHVSIERLRRIVPPALAPRIEVLSVLDPLATVAERLQVLQPDVLITYPSCAVALAQMQAEGSLQIAPTEIWLGGEQVSSAQRRILQANFSGKVRNAYGASEFYSIAFECAHGQLHVNDDWVILEAIDSQRQPVALGELSHTTLLTNLANRTQPLLRYQLDDQIRFVPQPCTCGCTFPVIDVQGRADDTLRLPGRLGKNVTILALALQTVIEEEAQITRFQIVCQPGFELELRLESVALSSIAAVPRCQAAVAAFLERHGVIDTQLRLSPLAPLCQPGSGKLRRVINIANGV